MAALRDVIFAELQRFYKAFVDKRILKTVDEVAANTNDHNLPSAVVVSEIYDNLSARPEWITDPITGEITGYKTPGGADTVFPFNSGIYLDRITASGRAGYGASAYLHYDVADYKNLKIESVFNDSSQNGNAGKGDNTSIFVYKCSKNYLNPVLIYSYGNVITLNNEQLISANVDISDCDYIKVQLSIIPDATGIEGGIKGLEIT